MSIVFKVIIWFLTNELSVDTTYNWQFIHPCLTDSDNRSKGVSAIYLFLSIYSFIPRPQPI